MLTFIFDPTTETQHHASPILLMALHALSSDLTSCFEWVDVKTMLCNHTQHLTFRQYGDEVMLVASASRVVGLISVYGAPVNPEDFAAVPVSPEPFEVTATPSDLTATPPERVPQLPSETL